MDKRTAKISELDTTISRGTSKSIGTIKIICDNKYYNINLNLFLKELSTSLGIEIFSIIRILKDEFEYINFENETLTHFNLEKSNHIVGKNYILPKIIKQGYFDNNNNKEVLPILDLKYAPVYICTKCIEQVSYEDVKKEDFDSSMNHIKNRDELFNSILKRYSVSLPTLSDDEIYNRGVSITTLKKLEITKVKISENLIQKILSKIVPIEM